MSSKPLSALLILLAGAAPVLAQTFRDGAQPGGPGRIVSCALAADEVLAVIAAPGRLAGVTRAADNRALSGVVVHPAVPRHSGTIEEILPLNPDLIFAAEYGRPGTPLFFESRGVPVARLNGGESIAAIKENIKVIGRKTGEEAKAESIIADFDSRLRALAPMPEGCIKPRILYYSEGAVTAGLNTAINDAFQAAGGSNAAAEAGLSGFVPISLELLLSLRPDILIFPGWEEGKSSPLAREVEADARWRVIPAVKHKQLHTVRASHLTTLSHHLAQGIEDLAALIRAWCPRGAP